MNNFSHTTDFSIECVEKYLKLIDLDKNNISLSKQDLIFTKLKGYNKDIWDQKKINQLINNDKIINIKSPLRVSVAGGGSDNTVSFVKYDTSCLNFSINKYVRIKLRLNSNNEFQIISHDLKHHFRCNGLSELETANSKIGIICEIIKFISPPFGLNVEIESDMGVKTGLGGSSALIASILEGFNELRTIRWTKKELVFLCFLIERILHKVPGGWQDQYAAVYGGINHLSFNMNNIKRQLVKLNYEKKSLLERSILLIDTKLPTESSFIQSNIKQRIKNGSLDTEMLKQVELAIDCKNFLENGEIKKLGLALNKSWILKQKYSSNIQNIHIEKIINLTNKIGFWGSKLLGTGGGGYILGVYDVNRMDEFCGRLDDLNLNFHKVKIETNGAKVVLND